MFARLSLLLRPRPEAWMGLAIAALITVVPYVYYRHSYSHAKRLRPIVVGQVYRAGLLTADGLREAIEKHKIRTVINLIEQTQDPDLQRSYFDPRTERESELVRDLGAQFKFVFVDLVPPHLVGVEQPATVKNYLDIMDDPANYPVLIHCKAGLHRTGCLAAVYRMEYQGWTRMEAWHELRSHGFGEFVSDLANDYVKQYVLNYTPRAARRAQPPAVPAQPVSRASHLTHSTGRNDR